ncbi:MAG: DUF2281 domain-containing protein [Nitrospinae bacterium]|nr:DUF2281 domain-containing protein [Nitrospinota bacterium]
MTQVLNSHYQKILEELKKLPEDKLTEVEDFIEFVKGKYMHGRAEELKDFELEEKNLITSSKDERKELEKTGRYSKEFLDQFERNIAKSSIYSGKS